MQRSVVAQGGTVVLTCTGEQANARSSPRSGYAASEHSRSQGATVRIIFSDGSHRSQIDGACPGGMPTMSVLEAAQIGDD